MGKVYNRYLDEVDWQTADAGPLVLGDDEVHVYQVQISSNLHRLEIFSATLTPAEKDRGSKYHQLKDRQRFVVSRGAQRDILSRYVNQPAAALEFILGDNKKPFMRNTNGHHLHYNVSHSGDWIIIAISRFAIGADVEEVDSALQFEDILDEHFSTQEVAYIRQGNTAERFFTLWTRKEALLKATGQGLGEHLMITPSLDGENILPLGLLSSQYDWQINSFLLAPGYAASVATTHAADNFSFFEIRF